MIYCELSGGLGNQLFQYAAARKMQIERCDSVNYFFTLPKDKKETIRSVSLGYFEIAESWKYLDWKKCRSFYARMILTNKILNRFHRLFNGVYHPQEKPEAYRKRLALLSRFGIYTHEVHAYLPLSLHDKPKSKLMYGRWHHPMYFSDIRDILVKELVLKDTSILPRNLMEEIGKGNSVCVHIRRGDYLNYPYYIVCDIEYYKKAMAEMKLLKPGCRFFVFSDDIGWVKESLGNIEDVVYVEEQHPDYVDFELMRRCDHFIISNSTFSWWAAYLGQASDKAVMTPDKWYNDGRNKEWLNLEGWIIRKTGI